MIGIALAVALVVLVVMAVRARPRWMPPLAFALGVVLGAGTFFLGGQEVIGFGWYPTLASPVLGAVFLGLGLQRFVGGRRIGVRGAAYALAGVAGGFFLVFVLLVAACGGGGCS